MKTITSHFFNTHPTDGQTDIRSLGMLKKEFIIRRAYIYKYIYPLLIMPLNVTLFT